MSDVIDLAKRRQRNAGEPTRAVLGGDPAPQYYCMRCGSEDFALLENGAVLCAGCGARIRNLAVSRTPAP